MALWGSDSKAPAGGLPPKGHCDNEPKQRGPPHLRAACCKVRRLSHSFIQKNDKKIIFYCHIVRKRLLCSSFSNNIVHICVKMCFGGIAQIAIQAADAENVRRGTIAARGIGWKKRKKFSKWQMTVKIWIRRLIVEKNNRVAEQSEQDFGWVSFSRWKNLREENEQGLLIRIRLPPIPRAQGSALLAADKRNRGLLSSQTSLDSYPMKSDDVFWGGRFLRGWCRTLSDLLVFSRKAKGNPFANNEGSLQHSVNLFFFFFFVNMKESFHLQRIRTRVFGGGEKKVMIDLFIFRRYLLNVFFQHVKTLRHTGRRDHIKTPRPKKNKNDFCWSSFLLKRWTNTIGQNTAKLSNVPPVILHFLSLKRQKKLDSLNKYFFPPPAD